MATKKSGGSVKNGRDSWSKRLGIKKNSLENVLESNIIIRGNNLKFSRGIFTDSSKNFNILARKPGFIKFLKIKKKTHIIII